MHLDLFLSAAVGIAALLLGKFLNGKIPFLGRVCIPAPVSGGIVVALLLWALHSSCGIDVEFDLTLKDIAMTLFFTSVGFESDFGVLKKGGRPLLIMVALVAVLITVQNLLGTFLCRKMELPPLLGLAAGSITLVGGHGTAGGFTPLLMEHGLEAAGTLTMAAATFGLVAGSLMGGPIAEMLIKRRKLSPEVPGSSKFEEEALTERKGDNLMKGCFELIAAAGIGSLLSLLLKKTGMVFPAYFGALFTAIIIRNASELIPGCPKPEMHSITRPGHICLQLFLGIAMVSLKLWELAGLALPLAAILLLQCLMTALFCIFAAFPLLGRNYDAALLVSGLCGFGLGSTPNAMANMSAVCSKYRPSAMPFLVVPLVGGVFLDIINALLITAFLNF